MRYQRDIKCVCLMFDYGRKYDKEILSAVKIVKSVKTECSIIKINLPRSGEEIPVYKRLSMIVQSPICEIFFVPSRG